MKNTRINRRNRKRLKKLHNNSGSTLMEALFAVLVVTLSLTILLGSVAAAFNAYKSADKRNTDYAEALEDAETHPTPSATPTAVVEIFNATDPEGADSIAAPTVTYYGNGTLYSYEYPAATPPA